MTSPTPALASSGASATRPGSSSIRATSRCSTARPPRCSTRRSAHQIPDVQDIQVRRLPDGRYARALPHSGALRRRRDDRDHDRKRRSSFKITHHLKKDGVLPSRARDPRLGRPRSGDTSKIKSQPIPAEVLGEAFSALTDARARYADARRDLVQQRRSALAAASPTERSSGSHAPRTGRSLRISAAPSAVR